jgi:hypothetical protein
MIRIGIIGLGWWGKQIVACLAHSPRFKVVAGCDIDTAMAEPFAAAHDFDLMEDYRELLSKPELDAVAVVTPHLLHEEMAIAGFAAGKQVFCEKPLALTTASAERILEACAKAGGVLGIGHAAQVEHTAHIIGLLRKMGDVRPALDLAHRHDVDAVLVVADRKADELRLRRCIACGTGLVPIFRVELAGCGIWQNACLLHVPETRFFEDLLAVRLVHNTLAVFVAMNAAGRIAARATETTRGVSTPGI